MSTKTLESPWLRRIRGLLAKAEATDFPEEAEALLAKAQELMTRHAIDEVTARAVDLDGAVGMRSITVPGPYAAAKSHLLGAVARANECRLVLDGAASTVQRCFLFGHATDLERVEVLFTSLCLQASRALSRSEPADRSRVRAFRHAFLMAYAARIGERLQRSHEDQWRQAAQARGAAIMLHRDRRTAAVEAAVRARFPRLGRQRTSASSLSGLRGGRAAADEAALGHRSVAGPAALSRGRA